MLRIKIGLNSIKIRFHLMATFLFIFCVSHFTTARASSDERVKQETEIHLNLDASEFYSIFHRLNLHEPSLVRTDFYFDAPLNGNFLMRKNLSQAKLRIQRRTHEVIEQKSWIRSQTLINTHSFTWLNTTRAATSKKSELGTGLSQRLDYTMQVLSTGLRRSKIKHEEKEYLIDLWSPVRWPSLKDFDSATENYPTPFLPAAIVKKERWLIQLQKLDYDPIVLHLGRDTSVLGEKILQSYELESEIEDPSVEKSEKRAKLISQWLQSTGVDASQTSPRSQVDFFNQLQPIYP